MPPNGCFCGDIKKAGSGSLQSKLLFNNFRSILNTAYCREFVRMSHEEPVLERIRRTTTDGTEGKLA
jgi:hypothetical protein